MKSSTRAARNLILWLCFAFVLIFAMSKLPERSGRSLGAENLYQRGRVAKQYGISAEANPWLLGRDRQDWLEGWMSVDP